MCETTGKVIRCRAAVAWEPNKPLVIEQIEVEPPRAHEVRIKIMYAALCRSDVLCWMDKDPIGLSRNQSDSFPVIFGHESAGIVESVGEGVTGLQPGDHVIPVFLPQCRNCKQCLHPDSNICLAINDTQIRGLMPDGTSRFRCKGKTIRHFLGTSSFSEYTVCADISVVKITKEVPLDKMCLLGCGISTGCGAALKVCQVKKGTTVAVWGAGAVGLAAIMGAKMAGAKTIVSVDTNPDKWESAKSFGATDFINPLDVPGKKEFLEYVAEKFDGGFDYTIECVGNSNTMRQALEASHTGWGVSCIVGVAREGEELHTLPLHLVVGRKWLGCLIGGWKTQDDIPKLVDEYRSGNMPLDGFITHRYAFDEINKAFDILLDGKSLRSVMHIGEDLPSKCN